MTSHNCKSCIQSCKQVCGGGGSPIAMKKPIGGGSPNSNCMLIKRCSSKKPEPTPQCNWVQKCSPVVGPVSPMVGPVSPVFGMHRRPHHHRHPRRMGMMTSPMRRISPYATTVIGRGRGPIRRVSVSPRQVRSPVRIIRRR